MNRTAAALATPEIIARARNDDWAEGIADDDRPALETKSLGAPANKMLGGRGSAAGDTQRDAIVAIGKAVVDQGRVIDRMARDHAAGRRHETFKEAASRRLEVKMNRPRAMGTRTLNHIGVPSMRASAMLNYRAAVTQYLRSGRDTHGGEHLSVLQRKAMHTELNPSGGYLVLPEHERSPLNTFLNELSGMRRRATVRSISSSTFQRPTRTAGASAGWVAESAGRPETAAPTLGMDSWSPMELYAEPIATQTMLDDAAIDIESWLAEEIAEAFNLQESDAWFFGDGVSKPRGLLTYPFVAPASWVHGSFRHLATGVSANFAASDPADILIDQVYTLKAGHRTNATWLMNSATVGRVRKIKDAEGRYVWQDSLAAGTPPTLLGYAVDVDEHMVDVGADTFAIGFGDWRKTYLIVDRIGVRVLRDPYSQKPFVKFYTTKRVGGGVQNFDAAIFLKFGTS